MNSNETIETNEKQLTTAAEMPQYAPNLDALLKRTFILLEDGEWDKAYKHCEAILDHDPENAKGYLGELMAEVHANTMEGLGQCGVSFSENNNYKRALRYSDEEQIVLLKDYCAKNEEICTRKAEEVRKAKEEKRSADEARKKKEKKKNVGFAIGLAALALVVVGCICFLVFTVLTNDEFFFSKETTAKESSLIITTAATTTQAENTTSAKTEIPTSEKETREDDSQIIKENADKIIEAFDIKEFQISSNYYVMLKNTSEHDLDIKLKGVFYNSNGSIIGAKDGAATAVQAGGDAIFEFYIGEEVAKSDLTFSIAGCIINFPRTSMVELTAQESSGRKVFATFVNNSEDTLYLDAWVVFYQDGKEVYERSQFEMNYEPGATLVLEFDSLLVDFDSYKVFYSAFMN